MTLLLAIGIGVLAGAGIWLMLRERSFDLILGLTLLSYAVNLFIFAMGPLRVDAAPIVDPSRAQVHLLVLQPLLHGQHPRSLVVLL